MPQVAFLFPGQGAQAVGMGRQLCETLPAARHLFDQAAEVLGYDLAAVCANGPAERLNSTAVSQPAIFVASLAALESLQATAAGRAIGLCRGGRAEPGRIHRPGLRRRPELRRRPAAWCADAARRCRPPPMPPQRHGQRPRPGRARRSRTCAPGARRRGARGRQPACARGTSSCPAAAAACDAVEKLAESAGGAHTSGWRWPGRFTPR